jgi:hypothetical protein
MFGAKLINDFFFFYFLIKSIYDNFFIQEQLETELIVAFLLSHKFDSDSRLELK